MLGNRRSWVFLFRKYTKQYFLNKEIHETEIKKINLLIKRHDIVFTGKEIRCETFFKNIFNFFKFRLTPLFLCVTVENAILWHYVPME